MKIAAVTEDGIQLSSHFGMAPSYRILTVEEGKIVADEIIEKPHRKSHGHRHSDHNGHQGMKFFDVIKDCQVLLCGGMGEPPYKRALSFGFEVFMVGGKIDAVIEAYLKGELTSDERRIHRH